ncbi:hypothetical protein GCM10025794_28220 [Massilia kyonggiensis]
MLCAGDHGDGVLLLDGYPGTLYLQKGQGSGRQGDNDGAEEKSQQPTGSWPQASQLLEESPALCCLSMIDDNILCFMINGIYDDVKDMQFAQEMRGETSEQAQGQEGIKIGDAKESLS